MVNALAKGGTTGRIDIDIDGATGDIEPMFSFCVIGYIFLGTSSRQDQTQTDNHHQQNDVFSFYFRFLLLPLSGVSDFILPQQQVDEQAFSSTPILPVRTPNVLTVCASASIVRLNGNAKDGTGDKRDQPDQPNHQTEFVKVCLGLFIALK